MLRSIPTAGVLPLSHTLVLRAVLVLGLALATAAAALPAAADDVSSAGSIMPTHLAIPKHQRGRTAGAGWFDGRPHGGESAAMDGCHLVQARLSARSDR